MPQKTTENGLNVPLQLGVPHPPRTCSCVLIPTHGLRWKGEALQQLWYCQSCGCREWKDVERVPIDTPNKE